MNNTATSDLQTTAYEDLYENYEFEMANGTDDFDTNSVKTVQWFFKMSSTALGVLFVLVLYKKFSEKRNNHIYDSLNWKHMVTSLLHMFLMKWPLDSEHGKMNYNSLPSELLYILEVSIPMWTVCISLKMFTDLYLFRHGGVYTARDLSIFGFCSTATIHVYELFFIMLGRLTLEEVLFTAAIRLTAVLLTISIPVAVACVIVKSLCSKSSDIITTVALFYLLQLVVFTLCDICIPLFIIASTTSQDKSVVSMSFQSLHYRLLLEIAWFIGSHYLGKAIRIYTNE